jgi:hypothetical protein
VATLFWNSEAKIGQNPSFKVHTQQLQPNQLLPRNFARTCLNERGPDAQLSDPLDLLTAGRANCRRRRFLCVPDSNPGSKPGDRHAVQKALL